MIGHHVVILPVAIFLPVAMPIPVAIFLPVQTASAPRHRSSSRDGDAQLAAVDAHRVGAYANFVGRPADASAFFDPATWARLRAVKAAYDPDSLFRGNHEIPPATAGEER